MRFTRTTRRPPPRPASRAARPRLPEITRAAEGAGGRGPAARPDTGHVKPTSYLVVSLLVSLLLSVFFLLGDHGLLEERRQRRELAALQAELATLFTENQRIEAEVARLKKDPRAVERIAREELGLVRPGEVVLKLPKGWEERVDPRPAKSPTPRP